MSLHRPDQRRAEILLGRRDPSTDVRLQPAIENRPVNAAEVGVEFQIAAIEIGQAGMFSEHSRLDRATEHEQRRGRAVVRSAIRILGYAASELTKGH